MRGELASLDIAALERELKPLEGARIDKVYQRDRDLTINIYNPGDDKYRLFLEPGKAFLTSYKRDNPQQPPGFCMFLRKHIAGSHIDSIEQYDFDRVLKIYTEDHVFIAELFGQGNYILLDRETEEITSALEPQEWSDRAVYKGEEYEPPEPGIDPAAMTADDLAELCGSRQIVKVLAADVGLGGVYAEEVLARTGMDKDRRSDSLSGQERETVTAAIHDLIETVQQGDLAPRIYYQDNGDPANVAPVALETYDGQDEERFETFSAALDQYFTERQKAEYRQQKRQAYEERKEELEQRKRQQEQMLEGMEDSIEEKQEIGDLIYEHYSLIEDLITTLKKARKQYSNDEIRERLQSEKAEGVREAQIVEDLQLANGQVVVDLGEYNATIDIDMGVEKNAEKYYEKSKEAKRKVEGAKESLEETREELQELEQNWEEIDVQEAFTDKEKKQEAKKWYEKYRWFFSSDGFLVVGGMDKTSNDVLVKKQMQPQDRYVHADFEGAPSVVVKNPDKDDIPDQTLEEAGALAITYSKAWKENIAAGDAYHVDPDQVTKEPESGEYLGKGAFVIRGDRSYLKNLDATVAVGAYEREGQLLPMGGPLSAVKTHCEHYVEVMPGRTKKSDVAKEIQHHLHDQTGEDYNLDKIMRALPPGKAAVRQKH